MLRIIRIVIAFIFISIVPFGFYMCRFGWQVIKHKQMPPGIKVIVGLYGGLYFPYKLEKVFGEQINQSAPTATSQN